jgi:DNA-binding LacI/PurR family transcriptional regulator
LSVRPTLKDVATQAGVSSTTVSLYLNGATHVCSEEKASRIRAAIMELNYVRGMNALKEQDSRSAAANDVDDMGSFATANRQARSYGKRNAATVTPERRSDIPTKDVFRRSARQTRTLGICVPLSGASRDTSEFARTEFAEQVWRGASEMAEWEEYRLLSYPLAVRTSHDYTPFLDGSISGLILVAGPNDPRPARLADAGLPVIVLSRFEDVPDGCGSVNLYENDTVNLALSHLRSLGHQRIAFLGTTLPKSEVATTEEEDQETLSPTIARRLERYRLEMRRVGIEGEELISLAEAGSNTDVEEALNTWRALSEPPTAIFCATDALALRLMQAAKANDISVPGELSIVGVGDELEAAEGIGGVSLTTVALPGEDVGREAVRLLLRMVEGIPTSSCRLAVPVTELVVRSSTATVPSL